MMEPSGSCHTVASPWPTSTKATVSVPWTGGGAEGGGGIEAVGARHPAARSPKAAASERTPFTPAPRKHAAFAGKYLSTRAQAPCEPLAAAASGPPPPRFKGHALGPLRRPRILGARREGRLPAPPRGRSHAWRPRPAAPAAPARDF